MLKYLYWKITSLYRSFRRRKYCIKQGIETFFWSTVNETIEAEKPVRINGLKSFGNNVKIGKFTYLEGGGRISNDVEIGRYCSIAGNVIVGMTNHPVDWITTSPIAYSGWKNTPY